MILLEPGTYNRASGEEFPILVPPGVILLGNEANQGKEIILEGGGAYRSASLGQQTVTLVLGSKAQLRGVTVINRATNGTGVWIEAADPAMQNCTLRNCGREGLVAVGTANPLIRDNLFCKTRPAA